MRPDDCPKFPACRAPICPLDKDWRLRSHAKGEPICHWLLEAAKLGAEARFRGAGRGDLFDSVSSVALSISARHAPIRRAFERAALSTSRMDRVAPGRAAQ
jgi:hypothetical protein